MSRSAPHRSIELPEDAVRVFRIPTEEPESDGTLKWDHTDVVVVQLRADGKRGLGYTYANKATAVFIAESMLPVIEGGDAMDIEGMWRRMQHALRNMGRSGLTTMALSAVDNALWDLKARILDLPLCKLLGMVRDSVPVYASGGFTSYDSAELAEKFSERLEAGHHRFKMKIGRRWKQDLQRMEAARGVLGPEPQLMVDANGAYDPRRALEMGRHLTDFGVSWYEEPVTSDDLPGLRFVRERVEPTISVAAGEYGYSPDYFRRMLEARALDVVQADATRCMGITGFVKAHALCEADYRPFSAHCAPALHLHPCTALINLRHIEYFRDHARLEQILFDGVAEPQDGELTPDLSRPGIGIELKESDAESYEIPF